MIEKLLNSLRNRYLYVFIFTLACISVIVGRLFYLQIVKKIDVASSMGQTSIRVIDAPRGNIYDCNGVLIATNRTAYIVQMVSTRGLQEDIDKRFINLINLFNKNGDSFINTLGQYLNSPTEWGVLLSGQGKDSNIKDWLNEIGARKLAPNGVYSPSDAFNYLRNEKYKIEKAYSDEEAFKICIIRYEITKNGSSNVDPIRISNEVSVATMAEIEARNLEFVGVSTEETYFRQYINPIPVAHVLGYVRSINPEEYELVKDQGYTKDDIIGKVGIEKAAETYLRGKTGKKIIYVDKNNRQLKELSYDPAVPGNDVYLTIDLRLQNEALNSLMRTLERIRAGKDNKVNFGDAYSGSVVVSNAKNGEILAMVSYPDYDPNLFLQPSTNKEAQQKISDLFLDKNSSPSLNRVTQGLYPPGSSFKGITAISELESGSLTADDTLYCGGSVTYDNQKIRCLGVHGSISLEKALAVSCNSYFCGAGVRSGIDQIDKWAKALGLGEKTGIEIGEYQGYRNNEETMKLKEKDKTHIWGDADTAQSAIGQLYNQFTPLQMNGYFSSIANGGYKQVPHLINKVVTKTGTIVFDNKPAATKVDVKPETIAAVKKGFLAVINYGSSFAVAAFRDFPPGFIAGKTGTPQTGEELFGKSSHANFVCYAPADDPEIVITVTIEHGVWGGNGAYVAADILKKYFINTSDTGIPNTSKPDGSQFVFNR